MNELMKLCILWAIKHGWLENTLYMEANSWEYLYFRKQAMFDYRRVITKRGISNSWMISCNLFSIITLKWLVVSDIWLFDYICFLRA